MIDLRSHWDYDLNSGRPVGPGFHGPVSFEIDLDSPGRDMPTIFTTPGFVARKRFVADLKGSGVDSVDVYPVVIADRETGQVYTDYEFVNIVGLVSCADMAQSECMALGPGINVIDKLVLDAQRTADLLMFRLAEDPLQIVVAQRVVDYLLARGYTDLYLEHLATA